MIATYWLCDDLNFVWHVRWCEEYPSRIRSTPRLLIPWTPVSLCHQHLSYSLRVIHFPCSPREKVQFDVFEGFIRYTGKPTSEWTPPTHTNSRKITELNLLTQVEIRQWKFLSLDNCPTKYVRYSVIDKNAALVKITAWQTVIYWWPSSATHIWGIRWRWVTVKFLI